jgi:hypothetical protein
MKRSNVKAWITAALAAGAIGGVAWATEPTPSAKTMGYYHSDNSSVHTDIVSIDKDREAIKYHKQLFKSDRKEDKTVAKIVDKKEISKSKADLKKDKRYLRADKKDLFRDHKASICTAKATMHKTKKELRSERRGVKREMRKGNYVMARSHMENAIRLTTILGGQETALQKERKQLKDDRVAIHNETKDERRNENGYAKNSVRTKNDESYSANSQSKK